MIVVYVIFAIAISSTCVYASLTDKYMLPLDVTGDLPASVKANFFEPLPTTASQPPSSTIRPKIYVYDKVEKYQKFNEDNTVHHIGGYANDFEFEEYILASKYVTTKPEEADYFYFRVHMYYGVDVDILGIIAQMKSMGPWYDRHNGRDHIMYLAQDYGGCQVRGALRAKNLDLLIVSQFGRVYAKDPDTFTPCHVVKEGTWGDKCDSVIGIATGRLPDHPCHVMGQDIVVPTPEFEVPKKSLFFNKALMYENRTNLLFYAGLVDLHEGQPHALDEPESDAYYSSGVRQTVYRMFHDEPGFRFFTKSRAHNYSEELSNSMFCLAALGWGWGGRMKAAVSSGCIPLIIAPHNKVEWEEQLPLRQYALRVPLWMAHKLPQIMRAVIRSGRAKRMQRNLWCMWRLHWWHRPHGRAFEMVMCELKRRLIKDAPPIRVNFTTCALYCGDDVPIPILTAPKDFV